MNDQRTFLQVDSISKHYKRTEALKDIRLSFPSEGIFGVFGRNGAGKSTLLDIIAGHKFPDSGRIRFAAGSGKSPLNGSVCYLTEKNYYPRRLKVSTLFSLCRNSYKGWDEDYVDRLCEMFGVDTEKRYGDLSRGTQSCVKIILGLASKEQVTVFDEPVLGLDAVARDRFYKELIEEYSREPRLFIISTHYIDEAANLFDEAVILEKGRVIKTGPVEDLTSRVFYVSGASDTMNEFLNTCEVLDRQTVGNITMAVAECAPDAAQQWDRLNFSRVSIQKLFVHLTDSENTKGGNNS